MIFQIAVVRVHRQGISSTYDHPQLFQTEQNIEISGVDNLSQSRLQDGIIPGRKFAEILMSIK